MPDTYSPDLANNLLGALGSPELEAIFWRPDREDVESAWLGHVPFAHWLVKASAPRCIVELGTHNGVSYAAFCRAVQRAGLGTRCFAVDTWLGDDQAGLFTQDVFDGLRAYHDERFGAFSSLLRCRFDEALALIPDRSIDLLHIDGRHGYDDVRHDFQSWQCKLSERAVVMLHDTSERRPGFGVWRFWSELQPRFPHFEFLHAHGLGVLAVGADCPAAVRALTALHDPEIVGAVRERFAQLGERGVFAAQVKLLARLNEGERQRTQVASTELAITQARAADAAHRLREEADQEAAAARESLAALQTELAAVTEQLDRVRRDAGAWEAARQQADRSAAQARLAQLAAEDRLRRQRDLIGAAAHDMHAAKLELADAQHRLGLEAGRRAGAETALGEVTGSGTWRATAPLRSILARIPPAPRRSAYGGLQRVWRLMTPHLNPLRHGHAATAVGTDAPAVAAIPVPPGPIDICYVSGEPHTPGTRYRVDRHAAAFAAADARVTVLRIDELGEHLALAGQCSTIVLWRVAWSPVVAAFVVAARAAGSRIVFDVDDLMIDPALATTAVIDGIRSQNLTEPQVRAHFGEVQRTMLEADLCFASTEELAGHMRRFGKPSMTVPNGFDAATLRASRMAVRHRALLPDDGLLRIGYAGGSRTHQRDFAVVAPALPAILRRFPNSRLVLFRAPDGTGLVTFDEFPGLAPFGSQVEWRDMVDLAGLPAEIARFDVNLAPLEAGNLFCEAKSELKYFEAALAGACTVASPTGPYARAMQHDRTGMLARSPAEWEAAIATLLASPQRRREMARHALLDVLWRYGPDRGAQRMRRVLTEWRGGAGAADGFALETGLTRAAVPGWPVLPDAGTVFSLDRLRASEVTVVVPLYNYAHTVVETLESVRAQTLDELDLVIVDDASTDGSLAVALAWLQRHATRFNRAVLVRNHMNAGLSGSRNIGFVHAETPWVLPLDADNMLRPACCELLLAAVRQSGGVFAYPVIQEFGARDGLIGVAPYDPRRLVGGNYIDAMALIARSAWCAVRGYAPMPGGWEDYEFWCALAEVGLHGVGLGGEPLADYRVHADSMLAQVTDIPATKERVIQVMESRHPWVHVARPLAGS